MATERVDSVGIGAGAGAGVLAKELATTGLRVVLFERGRPWRAFGLHGGLFG